MYNNGSLNPRDAPWLCHVVLRKGGFCSMIAQCRSSSLALGCSCKPWEALGTFFLWQGLDVQKVTHFECWMANMCSWLYMFATVLANLPQTKATVVNGPRNGMNGVQRAHRILPMQTCSGQSE